MSGPSSWLPRSFADQSGIDEVLSGTQRGRYGLDHARSGELILVSAPNSWQAYYYWLADDKAPGFARTVDIHRKPGYDPVELHVDLATRSIPLDAALDPRFARAPAVDPRSIPCSWRRNLFCPTARRWRTPMSSGS